MQCPDTSTNGDDGIMGSQGWKTLLVKLQLAHAGADSIIQRRICSSDRHSAAPHHCASANGLQAISRLQLSKPIEYHRGGAVPEPILLAMDEWASAEIGIYLEEERDVM